MPSRFTFLTGIALFVISCTPATAGDWPQILGPHRNGHGEHETLADSWPAAGPKTVWEKSIGSGLAGVAVAGAKVILFHRKGDEEIVEAFQATTGKSLWATGFPTTFQPSINPDNGPRSIPAIHKNRVVVFGAQGGLRCLDLNSGKTLWERNTHKDYSAQEGYFGAGSSPIVEGKNVVVNVGGRQQSAGIVAFDLISGKTAWKTSDDSASYSSPVAVTIEGIRHLIFSTRYKTVSLNPTDGSTRFEMPFGARGPTVNGANPLVLNGHLFLTASYGIGAVYAKIEKSQIKTIWSSDEVLSSQYTTCVEQAGKLIGIHGRQDIGTAEVRCIDPKTQKVLWSKTGFGYGTLIKADGKVLALKTNGELVLFKADTTKYQELASTQAFNSTTRPLPALSNGFLYIRDGKTLKCLDLRKK